MANDEITIAQNERFLLQKEYLGENKPINLIQPVVSVTVATYQHVNYIRECLDGILMQKTNFPYEIILGEDGSVDGTQEICKEYAEKYPDKVRLFIRDRKLSQYMDKDGKVTRFNGIWNRMSARGKYIAWCEGDDYWIDPLKLQKQVDFLESHLQFGMVVTNVNQFIQNENKIVQKCFDFKEVEPLLSSINSYIIKTIWAAPCTWIFRKDFYFEYLNEIGEGRFIVGDCPLLLFLLYRSKVLYLDEITAVYRILENSASHANDLFQNYKIAKGVLDIKLFFIEKYSLSNEIKNNVLEYYVTTYFLYILLYGDDKELNCMLQHFKFQWKSLKASISVLLLGRLPFLRKYLRKCYLHQ